MTIAATDNKKIVPNELKLRLQGKIDKVEQFNGQNGPIFETIIVLPSQDSYTSPSRFSVKSDRQIDKAGASVDVIVNVKSRFWKNNAGKVNYNTDFWLDNAA